MATTPAGQRLDVIIYGATGFCGAATVAAAVPLLRHLRWGIAGRNAAKLHRLLRTVSARLQCDLAAHVQVFVADVHNELALRWMASRTRVLINCAGPYRQLGRPIVEACLAAGTHQLDIAAEPEYIGSLATRYHDAARAAGVYVISACGFASLPAELGTQFAEQQFTGSGGELHSVDAFTRFAIRDYAFGEVALHSGTWDSAVLGMADWQPLLPLWSTMLCGRGLLHRAPEMEGRWSVPYPSVDRALVQRTQEAMTGQQLKARPIEMRMFLSLDAFWHAAVLLCIAGLLLAIREFRVGRWLLMRYPRVFTAGFCSAAGPGEGTQSRSVSTMTLVARGWSRRRAEVVGVGGGGVEGEPDKIVKCRVEMRDPAYGGTAKAVLLCALTLLREEEMLPGCGGVLSPGEAFARTRLRDRLQADGGFAFEVMPCHVCGDKDKCN